MNHENFVYPRTLIPTNRNDSKVNEIKLFRSQKQWEIVFLLSFSIKKGHYNTTHNLQDTTLEEGNLNVLLNYFYQSILLNIIIALWLQYRNCEPLFTSSNLPGPFVIRPSSKKGRHIALRLFVSRSPKVSGHFFSLRMYILH